MNLKFREAKNLPQITTNWLTRAQESALSQSFPWYHTSFLHPRDGPRSKPSLVTYLHPFQNHNNIKPLIIKDSKKPVIPES